MKDWDNQQFVSRIPVKFELSLVIAAQFVVLGVIGQSLWRWLAG